MKNQKPRIVLNRSCLIGMLLLLLSITAAAQEKQTVYILFDSQNEGQNVQKIDFKDELWSLIFSFKTDKKSGTYDFHFANFKMVEWVKQKGDTTFYAGKEFFEGKKCYDGAWFKQAFKEEADFMDNNYTTIFLIDIRDQKDGKYRVYYVTYWPDAVM